MPNLKDLTGNKYNWLTVISKAENSKSNQTQWLCKCDCGKQVVVRSANLLNGHTKSCGCYSTEVKRKQKNRLTHGMSHTRLHNIWCGMKNRCFNEHSKIYKHYGGKGIRLCDEWLAFEPFCEWAIANGYNDTLTIDRIDVSGNYEPSNCRWVDKETQMNNMRHNIYFELDGEKLTIPQIERKLGFPPGMVRQRVFKLGWRFEDAIKYPPHISPKKLKKGA